MKTKKITLASVALLLIVTLLFLPGCNKIINLQNSIELPDTATTLELLHNAEYAPASDFTYMDDDGGVRITQYAGINDIIKIPETINGLQVKAVAPYAFETRKTTIKAISFPNSITEISSCVCADLEKLEVVLIGENVRTICDSAFYGCTNLSHVELNDGLFFIRRESFAFCTSLKEIYIPSSVSRFETGIFNGSNVTIKADEDSPAYNFFDLKSAAQTTAPTSSTMPNIEIQTFE